MSFACVTGTAGLVILLYGVNPLTAGLGKTPSAPTILCIGCREFWILKGQLPKPIRWNVWQNVTKRIIVVNVRSRV